MYNIEDISITEYNSNYIYIEIYKAGSYEKVESVEFEYGLDRKKKQEYAVNVVKKNLYLNFLKTLQMESYYTRSKCRKCIDDQTKIKNKLKENLQMKIMLVLFVVLLKRE